MFAKAVRVFASIAVLSLPATMALAQDTASTSDLEARVAELEAQLATAQQPMMIVPPPQPSYGGIYTSFDAVWYKPHLKNPVAVAFNNVGVVDGPITQLDDYDWDHELTPRGVVGFETACGIGARGAYWQFDHDGDRDRLVVSDATTVGFNLFDTTGLFLDAAPGDTIQAVHGLEMHTIDFELTRRFRTDVANLLVAGGVRWARVAQFTGVQITGGAAPDQLLTLEQELETLGPTIALEAIVPTRFTGLRLYADTRGSVLPGRKDLVFVQDINTGAPGLTNALSTDDLHSYVGIIEIAIGVEYARGIFFTRAGWEGQLWLNSGDAAAPENDMALEGYRATFGIRI